MNQSNIIHVEFNYPDKAREDFTLDIYVPERALGNVDAFRKEANEVCHLVIAQLNNPSAGIPLEDHPVEAIVLLANTLGTEVTKHNPNIPKSIMLSLTDIVPSHQNIYIKLDVPTGMSVDLFSERTAAKMCLIKEELKIEPLLGKIPMAEFIRGRLSDGLKTRAEIVTKEEYQHMKANQELTDLQFEGLTPEQIRERTSTRWQQEAEVYRAARDSFEEKVERDRAFNNEPPALGSGDFSRRFQNYLDGRVTAEDLAKGYQLIEEHRAKLDKRNVRFTDLATGKEVELVIPQEFAEKFFNPVDSRSVSARTELPKRGDFDGDELAPRLFKNAPWNFRPMLDFLADRYGEEPVPVGKSISDYNDEQARKAGITLPGDESFSKRTPTGESSWVDENRLVPAIHEFIKTGGLGKLDTNALVMLVGLSADASEELKKRRIDNYCDQEVVKASRITQAVFDSIVNPDNQLQTMIDNLTPEDRSIYIDIVQQQLKSPTPVIYIQLGYSGKLTDALLKCAELKNWPLA